MTDVLRVSPVEAKALVDAGWTYVDVRSVPEFEAEHPAGAQNVPYQQHGPSGLTPNPDFLAIVGALHPSDAKLVLGCRSGARSLRAARELMAAGFTQVVDQRAGLDGARDPFGQVAEAGWKAAGLPVTSGGGGAGSYQVLSGRRGPRL